MVASIHDSTVVSNTTSSTTSSATEAAGTAAERVAQVKAYRRLAARIAAADADDTMVIGLDTVTASQVIRKALAGIMKYRDEAAKQLPDFNVADFDDLADTVSAALYTQQEFQSLSAPPEPIQDLVDRARTLFDHLLVAGQALAHGKAIDAGFDGDLSRGLGYAQLANDLGVMFHLFTREWPRITGKSLVTEAEVQEAGELSDRLSNAVATREARTTARNEMGVLRQKAKVLMVETLNSVRHAIEYLRRKEGDAAEIVPSLFAGRTLRKKVDDELDVTDDTLPFGKVPVVPPPAPVPTPGGIAPAPLPRPADPSGDESDPFTK